MLSRTPGSHLPVIAPDYIANAITDVNFTYLEKMGIKAIFVDLDGTVVARGTYDVASDISQTLSSQPLKVFIATNRPKSRDLKNLKQLLNANGVIHPHGFAGKPFPRYFKTACREHNLQPHEVAMIGDRYIQDIIGAHLAGLATIVVYKLDASTNWFDHLLSGIERRLTRRFARKYRETA
jgi:HAD superfamily phosphatase (TIGR01668 family)